MGNFTFQKKWVIYIIFFSLLVSPNYLIAQRDGDTTIVQAFTYGSPQTAWFNFPPATDRFQKILMLYTLKCNPAQNPACGQWDYITNTELYQHTGRMDSTLLHQPSYVANNSSPDSFQYSTTPTYLYVPHFEKHVVYDSVISLTIDTIGSGTITNTETINSQFTDGKAQYLWTAAELTAHNVTAGNITGLRLNLSSLGNTINNLTVKIKASTFNTLVETAYEKTGFTTVYSERFSPTALGWQTLAFTTPFNWDGISNLVVEFDFDNNTHGTNYAVLSDSTGFASGVHAGVNDYVLGFKNVNYVSVPSAVFTNIDSQITISLWQYGDTLLQPQNDIIFEGYNAAGQRVLNCHLPWSDSNVYWDAGNNGGGYDRINKVATAAQFKGGWNHWAFTKNVSTGVMSIYCNGSLFATGSGKHNSMAGVVNFKIGSSADGVEFFYAGLVNEFQIWNTVLDSSTIKAWMYKDVDSTHPFYSNLKAYYKFDEGTGNTTADASGNGNTAHLIGLPTWQSLTNGDNVRNIKNTTYRPNVILEQGVYTSHIDSVLIIDTIVNHQVSIIQYLDSTHATTPTDTLYGWPSNYYNYTYNAVGQIIDSVLVVPNVTLHLKQWAYYSAPFEVVIPYEIARYITPYGINLSLGNGWTWVYDMSDYRPLLHDSVQLSAGNWQELLDVKFMFIYGTPPRDIVKIENVWDGTYNLVDIAQTLLPKTITLDPSASMFRLKTRASGHGWDNATNCAEFCPKTHTVSVNGFPIKSWTLIKDCGMNPLFPQGGTWLIDRAGWCPGDKVLTFDHEVTPWLPAHASQVTLDYQTDSDANGNYDFHSQFISYSAPNFKQDAAIVDVIAPTNQDQYKRFNPRCDNPIVIIQNTGSTPLTQLDITYGVDGGRDCYYTWKGNLKFLEVDTVALPTFDWTGFSPTNPVFHASVDYPNGGVDQYRYNDSIKSTFTAVPLYDTVVILQFTTNGAANENTWELRNDADSVIYSGGNYANNTVVKDTFHLIPGCYKFTLFDAAEDGISYFANNDGTGSCKLRKLSTGVFVNLQPDFGQQITQYFMAGYNQGFGPPKDTCVKPVRIIDTTGITTIPIPEDHLYIYPNPTDNHFFVRLDYVESMDVTIKIFNNVGALVDEKVLKQANKELVDFSMTNQPAGVYLISVTNDKGTTTKKVIISR